MKRGQNEAVWPHPHNIWAGGSIRHTTPFPLHPTITVRPCTAAYTGDHRHAGSRQSRTNGRTAAAGTGKASGTGAPSSGRGTASGTHARRAAPNGTAAHIRPAAPSAGSHATPSAVGAHHNDDDDDETTEQTNRTYL